MEDSHAVQLAGKFTMIAGLVLLFFLLLLLLFLHLYSKRYNVFDDPNSFVEAPKLRGGLDPSVIDSLTSIVVGVKTLEGLECAVCLSNVVEGDKARMLPKCEHKFHVECIDMWFKSHSTCPLCRGSLVEEAASLAKGFSSESPNFPTNVLFWGDQTRVSSVRPGNVSSSETREEGMLVIGIVPSEESEMATVALALGSSSPFGDGGFGGGEEELKAPVVATRLRSLKRLLSRDRRAVSACSPSAAVDVEEGRV